MNKKGFSLIEMSVVVVIISLVFVVSLNAVKNMYTAYGQKEAEMSVELAYQEILSFAAERKLLPTQVQFEDNYLARATTYDRPPLREGATLKFIVKKGFEGDFTATADNQYLRYAKEYCSFDYEFGADPAQEKYETLPGNVKRPFAFAIEYQYKNYEPVVKVAGFYEFLNVLGCAENIKPSFASTELSPIKLGTAYSDNIVVKPAGMETQVQVCIEVYPIPDGPTDISGKFGSDPAGIFTNATCTDANFASTAEFDYSINITMGAGENLGSYEGARFVVNIRDLSGEHVAKRSYNVFSR